MDLEGKDVIIPLKEEAKRANQLFALQKCARHSVVTVNLGSHSPFKRKC
jgi:hypothetical protein